MRRFDVEVCFSRARSFAAVLSPRLGSPENRVASATLGYSTVADATGICLRYVFRGLKQPTAKFG